MVQFHYLQRSYVFPFVYYRISKSLTDIYYGRVKHPWGMNLGDWDIEKEEAEKVFEYKSSLEKHFHT